MDTFEKNCRAYFETAEHSLYKICLDLGLDLGNTTKALYRKRPTPFDTRMELIQKICQSPKMALPYGTMLYWLASEYLPPELLGDPKAAATVQPPLTTDDPYA